ncbi:MULTISPECIES: HU family DNA-binding protein [unclassified Deinococcus]|uniref:HU family DNA-binding protein n=1 Tax=unclassified Deinococcus TaxID=2623546 RepID=UPI0009924E10|nr:MULTISPECIES: HU family DNA-binding protein [unclassified Deinococcus]MBX8464698.1 HU family DNA-binding protein [Deinococcus sp. RIT780]MCD0160749.1 HU family DNA-binding protein [Deinococcus sp. 6YEL10]MCD0167732.1 HU family DNA-binding protein [Deinococcus sp. 12RED42]MCD0171834.1 HU family DNA-binding protein [Deinococcus sp. 23YEL01]OOV14336.1 DNA-binding protein [Deinococcus sp. LM3]
MAKSSKPAAKKPATRPAAKASKAPVEAAPADAGKIAKTQIIDMVADRTTLNKKQAGEAVSTLVDCVIDALRSGHSVGLPGLGTLSIAQTAARTGVKPGTSERITIPAGKKVRFKVATTLKGTL